MATDAYQENEVILSSKKKLELWNFYHLRSLYINRAMEILIDASLDDGFIWQWGSRVSGNPSYNDTIRATQRSVKKSRERISKNDSKRKQRVPSQDEIVSQDATKSSKLEELVRNMSPKEIVNFFTDRRNHKGRSEAENAAMQAEATTKYPMKDGGKGKKRKGDKLDGESRLAESSTTTTATTTTGEPEEDDTYLPFDNIIGGSKKGKTGDVVLTSEDTDGSEISWMDNFIRDAIKYKAIFGIVPFMAGADINGKRRLYIPNINSGNFVAFLDDNYQIKVYWRFEKDAYSKVSGDRAYAMYWPYTAPLIHRKNSPFNSVVYRLMDEWYTLSNTKNNKLHADWMASHIPIITKCTEKLTAIDEMTTGEIFGQLLGGQVRRNGLSSRSGEKAMIDMNSARRSALVAGMMNSQKAKEFIMQNIQKQIGEDFDEEEISRATSWEMNKVNLPYGRDSASVTIPRAIADYKELKSEFINTVSMILGVQLTGMIGTGRAKTTIESAGQQGMFTASINSVRRAGKYAIEECFTIALGEQEDEAIYRGLNHLKGSISKEMDAIRKYEALYGRGDINPYEEERKAKDAQAADIDNEIYGKANQVIQFAIRDGVTLEPAMVRQHIRDRVVRLRMMQDKLSQGVRVWKSETRLEILWRMPVSRENIELLMTSYKEGLINKEAVRIPILNHLDFPLDTPEGISELEKMEEIKADHALELERVRGSEKIRLEKSKPKPQLGIRTSGTGGSGSSGRQGPTKGPKTGKESASKKQKTTTTKEK